MTRWRRRGSSWRRRAQAREAGWWLPALASAHGRRCGARRLANRLHAPLGWRCGAGVRRRVPGKAAPGRAPPPAALRRSRRHTLRLASGQCRRPAAHGPHWATCRPRASACLISALKPVLLPRTDRPPCFNHPHPLAVQHPDLLFGRQPCLSTHPFLPPLFYLVGMFPPTSTSGLRWATPVVRRWCLPRSC